MTSSLLTLNKNTSMVVAMEGGYNLEVIPLCMEAVVMAMRGETWDEDGMENPLAVLSSPQPKHKNRISLSADPLVRARLELNKYWDFYEENPRTRGKRMATGAVVSINKVVEVILEGGAFGDVKVRKVRDQIPKRDGALGGRGKKKVAAGDDYLGATGMDSLMSAMGAVKIGNNK